MIIVKREEKEIGKEKLKSLIVVARKKKSKKSRSPFFSMKNLSNKQVKSQKKKKMKSKKKQKIWQKKKNQIKKILNSKKLK